MNIKPLIIALLLTVSSVHAGLLEEMRKHPYITAAAGTTVLLAAVVYGISQSSDDHNHQDLSPRENTPPVLEIDNHSPIPITEAASTFYSIEKDTTVSPKHPNGLAAAMDTSTTQAAAPVAKTNKLHTFDRLSGPNIPVYDKNKKASRPCIKKKSSEQPI